jgi:HD-GYP domain-containing protein (c-di-GMP phosphodiesterase class II)
VRHCIETAVVTMIAARGMQLDAGQTLTLAAAALTMNVGMLRHHELSEQEHPLTTRKWP